MTTAGRLPAVTQAGMVRALAEVGVRDGDLLYVAASLAGLGHLPDPAEFALRALRTAVGPAGTLVMPSGSKAFRFQGGFDREASPSESGLLSEYFRTRPGVLRTSVPPFNTVCVQGPLAAELAGIESATAFGPGSVFDRLVTLDALVVLLGCSFHDGVAHVHWLEERHEPVYRHWEQLSGWLCRDGVRTWHRFACQVRNPGVELSGDALERRMTEAGAIAVSRVGLTRIAAFRLGSFAELLDDWFAGHSQAMIVGPRPVSRPGPAGWSSDRA